MDADAQTTVAFNHAAGATAAPRPIPFDAGRLDALMEEAGIDALIVTSKHNIQYLLGGYRFFFFDHFDAIGVSRYLPILVYVKGHPERATYIGHPMESYEQELNRFWVPNSRLRAHEHRWDAGRDRASLRRSRQKRRRIGIERAFLPADAESALRKGLPRNGVRRSAAAARTPSRRQDAAGTGKPCEWPAICVVDSMLAVIAGARARRDQARIGRGAPPRGSESRPQHSNIA